MSKRTTQKPGAHGGYWEERVRSTGFKRELTALVSRELRSLAAERVHEVIQAADVRKMIQDWDFNTIDRDLVADMVIEANRYVAHQLKREEQSLIGLLDPQLVHDIDAILKEEIELPGHIEDFVANLMEQEFIRRLFTDIIFTAIVAFNRRVNPFFAAVTTRVLEEQIKGFIRLFMPMLQKQAIAFAVSRNNQRIVLDFTRAIIRQLLDEPLMHYSDLVSDRQRRQAEGLLRKAVRNPKLESLLREASLSAWDQLYKRVQHKKVGELVDLERHAGFVARRVLDVIRAAVARPDVARFIDDELALAHRERGQ